MDLLAFENKLDSTIMRKRLDIQESLKKPIKQKRTLRFFVSTNYYPSKNDDSASEWELRVEGIHILKAVQIDCLVDYPAHTHTHNTHLMLE